jgi:hypothetical protein
VCTRKFTKELNSGGRETNAYRTDMAPFLARTRLASRVIHATRARNSSDVEHSTTSTSNRMNATTIVKYMNQIATPNNRQQVARRSFAHSHLQQQSPAPAGPIYSFHFPLQLPPFFSSSSLPSFSVPKNLLGQIFSPIFSPSSTGNPACTTLPSPSPSSFKFTQKIALPTTGLNLTPLLFPSRSSLTTLSPYHFSIISSSLAGRAAELYATSTFGNHVSPPVQFALKKTKNDAPRLNWRPLPSFMTWCWGQKSVCKSYFCPGRYRTSCGMLKGSWGSSMLPMKVRARFRIHDTSGCLMGSGAEEEVRPETRVLGPRERDMKDDAKSGELGRA